MRQVLDVNILEDQATQRRVTLLGLPAGIAALILMIAMPLADRLGGGVGELQGFWAGSSLGWAIALLAVYIVSLPVHELVHAAFFKLFGPAGTRITFGFKSGMLYAGCPGRRFSRGQMTAVLLAPFALLSLTYLALGALLGLPFMMLAVFLLHTSGCVGDFYFAWLIARHPEADLIEDTPVGICLWSSAGE